MKIVFKLCWVGLAWALLSAVGQGQAAAADFTVTAPDMTQYLINGASNPTLTLTRGKTYSFDVESPGHPFFIKTAAVTGTGSTFDTGVTGNGTSVGPLTFAVPTSAPNTLFYNCQFHTPMTGTINIISAPVPATGWAWKGGLAVALLLAGTELSRQLRRRSRLARLGDAG
jgi:hypothetical protein